MSLWSSAILLPPLFYFSYFAMNIKATCSFLSLLVSDTGFLSKQLIASCKGGKGSITTHKRKESWLKLKLSIDDDN